VQNPASDFGLPGTRSPFCSSANFRTHYSSVKINISGTESHQLTSAQAGESGEDHQRPKPTWHQRQPPHPGGPRVRGCLTTLIPRGTAQSWRADLCITPAPWLASPVRRSPPDHSRCRLERTPRVQRLARGSAGSCGNCTACPQAEAFSPYRAATQNLHRTFRRNHATTHLCTPRPPDNGKLHGCFEGRPCCELDGRACVSDGAVAASSASMLHLLPNRW
jgi:hypothetical protein